jgi:hypothetical protein
VVTRDEAEKLLTEWCLVTRHRDNRVRAAAEAGVSRYRIGQQSGLAKTTIIRILRADGPDVTRRRKTSDDLRLHQIR